jgi:hypothetical protein
VITDKASVIAALQKAGITLTSAGLADAPYLSTPTEAFNGGTFQIAEYADEAAAARDAGKIQPDGTVPGKMISWLGQPHFYRAGRVILVYIGNDPALLTPLEAILGKPFATGRSVSGTPPGPP